MPRGRPRRATSSRRRRNRRRRRQCQGRQSWSARVLETPGHTLDHICYIFDSEKIAFLADTLFSVGCGRVIEGTMPQMWHSLLKLRALPDDMAVPLRSRIHAGQHQLRADHRAGQCGFESARQGSRCVARRRKPTLPSTIGAEKKHNCFLRADIPSVAAAVGLSGKSAEEVFAEIRLAQKQVLIRRHGRWDRSRRPPTSSGCSISSRIRKAGITARRFAIPDADARDARPRPRSISCWRAASDRIGIASMRSRSGTGMPARRWRSRSRRRQEGDAEARPRSRGRRSAARNRSGRTLAGGGKPRRLDAGRLHGRAGFRIFRLRAGAEGLGA